MTNIKYIVLSILILGIVSCNDEIVDTLQGEYIDIKAQESAVLFDLVSSAAQEPLGAEVSLIAAPQSSPINFTFEIVDSTSTAIPNIHYSVNDFSGSIPAGATFGEIPILIETANLDLDESYTIDIRLVSSDAQLANTSSKTYSFGASCESDLGTSYTYSHTNNFAGTDLSGMGELTGTDGVYTTDDFSFGSWAAAYGAATAPPGGALTINENCGTVSYNGTDRYGDIWFMDEILASDGPEFTFTWSTSWDGGAAGAVEFGTVTLTKDDGSNWPPLKL